jgi:hypothetical protein
MPGEFQYEPPNPNDTVAEVGVPSTSLNLANIYVA